MIIVKMRERNLIISIDDEYEQSQLSLNRCDEGEKFKTIKSFYNIFNECIKKSGLSWTFPREFVLDNPNNKSDLEKPLTESPIISFKNKSGHSIVSWRWKKSSCFDTPQEQLAASDTVWEYIEQE